MQYKIIDNFLPQDMLKVGSLLNPFISKWFRYPAEKPYQNAILEEANKYFPLDACVGFEEWSHNPHWSPLPNPHYDKDEKVYSALGILKFPICSCILYLKVENLIGAHLYLDDIGKVIRPRTNRLVLLAPGVFHSVTEFKSGTRVSVNINPWDYPINKS